MGVVVGNSIYVVRKDGARVEAKILRSPDGTSVMADRRAYMLAPVDYDPIRSAQEAIYRENSWSETSVDVLVNFKTDGPLDLQRSYNGKYSQGFSGFVDMFTPVASYSFGYTGAALGYSLDTLFKGGGALERVR